jgi:predicted  nucleic acid-binding Zn-ribbon protein
MNWPWLLAGVLVLIVIVMLAVLGLISFVKWAAHIEFTSLTSTLHKDISDINAKLAFLAKTEWSDVALARKFSDVDSVAGDNQRRLSEVEDDLRLAQDEEQAIRDRQDAHDERLRTFEKRMEKAADLFSRGLDRPHGPDPGEE